jgi:esterase/lipase superfamily enzyme
MRLITKKLILFITVIVLAGCSASTQAPPISTLIQQEQPVTAVDVLYGTNRLKTGEAGPNNVYGQELGELQYGVCQVTIPANHAPGEIERPHWYTFEFVEDPQKHVTIRRLTRLSADDFTDLLQQSSEEMNSDDILIFIHGFSNTFDEAVRRAGQISYDLGFPGITMAYSWPSQGEFSISNYDKDEEYVKKSIPFLKKFLLSIVEKAPGKKINIIAHSMGNRLVTNTIAEIERNSQHVIFNQIILAAPDVDAKVFKEEIFPKMRGKANNITLYASSDDKALLASRLLHDNSRLGESGEYLTVIDGMDTIDSTGVDPSTLGHSYFSSTQTLLADIHNVIIKGSDPAQRNLKTVEQSSHKYWKMVFDQN